MATLGTHCPHCKQAYTEAFIESKQTQKSIKMREAHARRRASGKGPSGRKIAFPKERIVDLANMGLAYWQIMDVLKCSKGTVHRALRAPLTI